MEPQRVSHYELGRRLGRGGMGEVYEAFDVKARRKVALKFIAPELAADPDSFRRFESEAVNAAQMQHPHIATLFEFEPEGERPFIAMELVPGSSLRERIAAGPLGIPEAIEIARDVASALGYAHRRNVIHRDIKPENLMFDEDGRVKVMDFGLARALLASRLTVTGSTLGTASYMSPEGLAGTSGPPGDVFALGLVFIEMLTGRQVFPGDNPLSVMFMIANQEPPSLRELRPDASDEVDAIARRMLAKDPAERIEAVAAAQEMARLSGRPLSSQELPGPPPEVRVAAPPASAAGSAAPAPASGVAVADASPRRRSPLAAWIPVALAAVIALVMWRVAASRVSPEAHQRAVLLSNQGYDAYRRGDFAAARGLLAASLQQDPRYGEASLNLGALYVSAHEGDSASMVYTRLLASHARDPRVTFMAHYGLGNLNMDSGTYEQAVRHFTAGLALDSTRREAFNGLGLALVMSGRAADGLAVLKRGLAQFPSEPALHKNAGLANWKLGDANAALREAGRALELSPGYPAALALRARAHARLGDVGAALVDWRAYTSSRPDSTERAEAEADLIASGVPAAALAVSAPNAAP